MPGGRPTNYTLELAEAICADMCAGLPISAISRKPNRPRPTTLWIWLNRHPEFAAMYARAKVAQADLYAAQIIELADTERVGERIEEKEVGHTCSECGKDLKWQGRWRHFGDHSVICEGAKAIKTIERKVVKGDTVDRSRLQIDARKWYASKLAPRKYGDRLELAGDPDNPVSVTLTAAETLRRRRAARLKEALSTGEDPTGD